MQIRRIRYFRGPNIHAPCPVLEIIMHVGKDDNSLLQAGQAFAEGVLKLQNAAGLTASFLQVRVQQSACVLAVECLAEPVGRAAAAIVERLLCDGKNAAAASDEDLQRLRDLVHEELLPVSTQVIYDAARDRGIPVRRLSREYGRFLLLGHGTKQHRCQASEPDSVSAVSRTASTDKYLAKELMAAAGVPVPVGKLVRTVEEAWSAACELGMPVAIKPQDTDLATGVSLDVRTREQVETGFHTAHEYSAEVLVERFAPGLEHRVLVVDGQIAAVTRIDPPHVIGDGVSTIAQLVHKTNQDPRRGDEGSDAPKSKLKLDDVAQGVLAGQGFSVESVPSAGTRVLVRRNPPYFKNGGNLVDLTDQIHPSTAAHAAAAAQALQLRVAGLDVVAVDIAAPLEPQRGVVVEINAGPGLWLHLAPWADSPRPVGVSIVGSMFPPGESGRIPVIALVGDGSPDGVAVMARKYLMQFLTRAGLRVGCVDPTTITVAGRSWTAPADPHDRAQLLFQCSAIDVAILETTAEELLRHGFGNDRCNVALLLTGQNVVSAQDDQVELTPGSYFAPLRHALVPDGSIVALLRDEPYVTANGARPSQLFLVASSGDLAVMEPLLRKGIRALAGDGESVFLLQDGEPPIRWIEKFTVDEKHRDAYLAASVAALAVGVREDAIE